MALPFTGEPVRTTGRPMANRTMRRPKHSWQTRRSAHRLTPIALAPVLAGDTLKSAAYMMRAITDPLASALSGWHAETWWFYCRIMDMENGADILAKIIDEDAGAYTPETADANVYHGYGIDWTTRCLKLIAPIYFRDYGETWDEVTEDGLPLLAVRGRTWFEHYIDNGDLPADDADAEDFENLWTKWQTLSRNRLTTATYEEFLASQGVKAPPNLREPDADLKIPELIRYHRDWQYPVSTIDPATGAASNAVSWAISDQIKRARRFAEPGFIIGLAAFRPKAYLPTAASTTSAVGQAGSASGALNTAKSWIPPVYTNEPGESLRSFTAGTGPLDQKATAFDYWIDHRDLFLDGDQMIIGTPDLEVARRDHPNWKYPTEASLEALFASASADFIRTEGMVTLNIASRVRRTTT